ncbi:MAG: hypothetical protein AB1Z98_34085, partial [Nannocystaceae bacterium]
MFVALVIVRSTSAAAAPYEVVEISPAGHTRAPLPLHQGVFLTGEASPDATGVAVVFVRRIGGPFGLGRIDSGTCEEIDVAAGKKTAKELPSAGVLDEPEQWLSGAPKRTRAFVSTIWTPKPSPAEAATQAPKYEVFVQDPVFFRPGASYCMVVLEQVEERVPNETVLEAIDALKESLAAYVVAPDSLSNTAFQDAATEVAELMRDADLATTTKETDALITAVVDAYVNVLPTRPLYAADTEAFDRTQVFPATSPFGRAILSLLAVRSEGQVLLVGGSFLTREGHAIVSVQPVDDGAKIRLEVQPPAAGKKKSPTRFAVVGLGLRDLRIPPPPAVSGQAQAAAVSLLDVLDALEGRLPGSRDPITASPPGCSDWGYACPETLDVAATRARAQGLGAIAADLERGRKDANNKVGSIHREVFEWAKGAFPVRTSASLTIVQQDQTRHTLAGVAHFLDMMVDAGEQWGPLQAKLDALAKTAPRIDKRLAAPVAYQELDQTTFVSNHVVPTTGVALLFAGRADEPALAYYGGAQIYLWPNPVNEPMWTRCRAGACPDLLRSFALEVGLTTTATTRIPANRTLLGVNGSSVIPLIGAALQPAPYLTSTVGVAFTGQRPLGLEGERWRTVPVFYLG